MACTASLTLPPMPYPGTPPMLIRTAPDLCESDVTDPALHDSRRNLLCGVRLAGTELAGAGPTWAEDLSCSQAPRSRGEPAALLHGSAVEPGEAIERVQQDAFGIGGAQLVRGSGSPPEPPNPKLSTPPWAQDVLSA